MSAGGRPRSSARWWRVRTARARGRVRVRVDRTGLAAFAPDGAVGLVDFDVLWRNERGSAVP